jgi:hypothetical protein
MNVEMMICALAESKKLIIKRKMDLEDVAITYIE